MRAARPPPSGQTWATFLHNHAPDVWAADFLPVMDLLLRPLHAFFVIEVGPRRVVQVGVTRQPSDPWVAQQLREATPFGHHPKHLMTDHDSKYAPLFAHVAAASGIDHIRTAYRAPVMNAVCDRFLGSVRRECLDHVGVFTERPLLRVLRESVASCNAARPHQGWGQRMPDPPAARQGSAGAIRAIPLLGGLHHTYCYAA